MKTVAIIQARMGSTRLPGKVMMDLAGEPMLVRDLNRVRRAATVDDSMVATTTSRADDVIADLCNRHGWLCFRGSENDVLDRYYQAAAACNAEAVVRITSDCPLIEPEVVDQVVNAFRQRQPGLDYACNFLPQRTFPRGLETEVIRFAALEVAWQEDRDPSWREHVTPYIYRNPDRFRIHGIASDVDYSAMRWTVDTPEDLALVERIYEHFGHDRFSWREVIALLDQHPDWSRINSGVEQKVV